MNNISEYILKSIVEDIESPLNRCGLMYRLFYRAKSPESIRKKISAKREEYLQKHKKMQDLFGLRVTLYFSDDVELVHNFLRSGVFPFVEESVNEKNKDVFCPQKLNIIIRLSDRQTSDFAKLIDDELSEYAELIDNTYEIQIRTVLSEGWHEVEHDLRYKYPDDWNTYEGYQRLLNGIFATLETSEWSMLSLFDNLAYSHYKNNQWDAMMRNKMRIKFNVSNSYSLSDNVKELLDKNPDLSRSLYKTPRKDVLQWILKNNLNFPLTYDTVLFYLNRMKTNYTELLNLEPEPLKKELNEININNL